jgi:hypothetical protein
MSDLIESEIIREGYTERQQGDLIVGTESSGKN